MKKYLYIAGIVAAVFIGMKLLIVIGTLGAMILIILGIFGFLHITEKLPRKKPARTPAGSKKRSK